MRTFALILLRSLVHRTTKYSTISKEVFLLLIEFSFTVCVVVRFYSLQNLSLLELHICRGDRCSRKV